jgi:hypothetical protein
MPSIFGIRHMFDETGIPQFHEEWLTLRRTQHDTSRFPLVYHTAFYMPAISYTSRYSWIENPCDMWLKYASYKALHYAVFSSHLSALNTLHSVIKFIFWPLVSQIFTTVKDANSTCNSITLMFSFALFIMWMFYRSLSVCLSVCPFSCFILWESLKV